MWLFIICAALFIISVLIIAGDSLSKWVGLGDIYDVLFDMSFVIAALSCVAVICCPLIACDSAAVEQDDYDVYYSYLMSDKNTDAAHYFTVFCKVKRWNAKVDRKVKMRDNSFTSWYVNKDWKKARKYDLSKIKFVIME